MDNMDIKTHKFLTMLLYLTYTAGYIVLFIFNTKPLIPVFFLTINLIISIFSHKRYYSGKRVKEKAKLILVIQMAIVFCLLYFDISTFETLFLFILIGDCVYAFGYKFSSFYTVITMALFFPLNMLTHAEKMGYPYSDVMLRDIIIMIFVIIILYVSKTQITEKMKYNNILEERNLAYEKLKEYSIKIEEMAVYEERSRIAFMLHNSIGHMLAAMNLSLQAKKSELIKARKIDKGDLSSIENQLKQTIELLRKTIENSKDFIELCNINELMDMLINNIQNDIRVMLHKKIEITKEIPKQLNSVIYNTILESVTNALKHSKCDNIFIEIKTTNNKISLVIKDDGIGFNNIVCGFGITKLKEKIENSRGTLNISGENGCVVTALIPL